MQHSSAQAASLAEENGIFTWHGTATLPRAITAFQRLGYVCLLADRQAGDLPPPLPEDETSGHRPADPEGYLIRRAVARALLGALLQRSPGAIRLAADSRGKPVVAGAPLYLSFSARDHLGLIGVGQMPIGVDYEPTLPPAGIPWNLLRAEERDALGGLAEEARAPAFLALWRAKEAALKALGLGFVLPPESVRVHGSWASVTGHQARIRLIDVSDLGITLGLQPP